MSKQYKSFKWFARLGENDYRLYRRKCSIGYSCILLINILKTESKSINPKPDANGKYPYHGLLDSTYKIHKEEGVLSLFV